MLRIQDIKPKIGAPKTVPRSPPANSTLWGLPGPTAPPDRRQWRRLGFPEAPRLGPAHGSAGRPLAARFSSAPVPGGPRGTFSAEGLLAMAGAGSAAVSGAGTPVAGLAGRDLFAEGLLEFLRPAVQQLDSHVHAVRESQVELREQIDNLATGHQGSSDSCFPKFLVTGPCGCRRVFIPLTSLPSPRTRSH
ncbi:SNARE-associated protein Snapin isoform X2 [Panthera leo]|uniref:SNARE-associated protein Snapin isoform X2 n=1 Tax=Panthera leo TaxID=9689 RepID=UPI001C6A1E0B|nr:SNARE-associated protein Snapin isoform X2 [Panthera leo]